MQDSRTRAQLFSDSEHGFHTLWGDGDKFQAKQLGVSDEQLRDDYEPPLTQAELDAAWDYYAKHREEIDQAIRDNEED